MLSFASRSWVTAVSVTRHHHCSSTGNEQLQTEPALEWLQMRFFPLEPSEPALILRLIPALLIIRVEPRLELRNSKKKDWCLLLNFVEAENQYVATRSCLAVDLLPCKAQRSTARCPAAPALPLRPASPRPELWPRLCCSAGRDGNRFRAGTFCTRAR